MAPWEGKVVLQYLFQLSSFLVQFLHLNRQFSFSLSKLRFLGSYNFCHFVIDVHGFDPPAQTLTCSRGILNQNWVKLRVRNVPEINMYTDLYLLSLKG